MRVLTVCAVLLGLSSAAMASDTKQAFQDLTKEHFAYAAVTGLEQSGVFTGYPAGTFSGTRARTRYEFAVAVLRMAADLSRPDEPPATSPEQRLRAAALDRVGLLRKPLPEGIERLADEFAPELKLLGSSTEAIKQAFGSGQRVPVPVQPPPEHKVKSKAYGRGGGSPGTVGVRRGSALFSRPVPGPSR